MNESAVLDVLNVVNNNEDNNRGSSLSKEELEIELADARLLHRLSIELIQEDGIAGLYKKIVEAAVAIMRSQFATMQIVYPEKGSIGKLRILACSGFTPEAEKYWEWIYNYTSSSCGQVLRTGKREVVPDYRLCEFMQNQPTLKVFVEGGILAAQSTPLYSRTGKLLGMISTHWSRPYNPPQRHLDLLDILARQAADLIERTQHAEALRESEEYLRALATATNDVLYRMSPDWTEMYHLDGRNFLSNTDEPTVHWLQKYVVREDQELVMTAVEEAVSTKTVFQLEYRVIKADGTIGWTSSRAIPIMGKDGEVTEWFGAASDITEKKSLWMQLEKMVDERTKELKRSNEDLQKFAHVASHDLKEPVRKIRTFGLRLQNELGDTINENARLYTDKVLESASRMSTMIDGVLNYSSLNGVEQKMELLDLGKILLDIQHDLELLIAEKGAIIQYDALPEIVGDQVLIHQLFYNLINNSLKFSKEAEKPVITISASTTSIGGADHVQIDIADNGIGFPPQYSETIFNPFTRLNAKHKYDGTGLGLTLARQIVERHQGTIHATGMDNEGTVVIIQLPVRKVATSH